MKLTYDKDSSAVHIALDNGCNMVQTQHPQTGAAVTADNFEAVAQACVPASDWSRYLKLKGVAFQGVMCSATAEDMWGLNAVLTSYQLQGANFQPTAYRFANGNTLTITRANMQAFMGTWMPFRQQFFAKP